MTERFVDIKVRTGNAEKEVKSLDSEMKKLSNTSETVNKSSAKLTKTAEGVKTGLAGVSRSAGQAGVQIQQFVGQVQGGQNAMLALSQQAADLGIVLGAPLLGAIVGISASLVGSLVPALFKSDDAVEELIEKMEKWKDTIGLTREQADFLINKEVEANKTRAESIASYTEEIRVLQIAIKNQEQYLESKNQNEKTTKRITEANRKTIQELNDLIALRQSETQAVVDSNQKIQLYNSVVGQSTKQIEEQTQAKKKNEEATKELSNILAQETLLLQTQLGIQQQVESGFITQRQANLIAAFEADKIRRKQRFEEELIEIGENNLAREELQAQFDENLLIRKQIFEQQLTEASEKGSNERVKITEREAKLKQLVRNQEISNFQSFASTGIKLIAAFGKKSFQAQKNFAIAESIVNIAGGVAKALNNPYPANLGFAAQVAAEGAILLSTIKSTNPSSSATPSIGGGSSASAPAVAPTQEAPQQQRVVDIRLDDDAILTGSAVKKLISSSIATDDDIVLQITQGQQELVRTGAI